MLEARHHYSQSTRRNLHYNLTHNHMEKQWMLHHLRSHRRICCDGMMREVFFCLFLKKRHNCRKFHTYVFLHNNEGKVSLELNILFVRTFVTHINTNIQIPTKLHLPPTSEKPNNRSNNNTRQSTLSL